MQDTAQKAIEHKSDPDMRTRLIRIRQMEKNVTQEINDRDYRTVYMPCLPLEGSLKHWR